MALEIRKNFKILPFIDIQKSKANRQQKIKKMLYRNTIKIAFIEIQKRKSKQINCLYINTNKIVFIEIQKILLYRNTKKSKKNMSVLKYKKVKEKQKLKKNCLYRNTGQCYNLQHLVVYFVFISIQLTSNFSYDYSITS